jgi:hypothetical protein
MTNKVLKHYGTPRHSGRYPWGSGEDPQQSHRSFLGAIDELKKQGLSDPQIAKGLGLGSTTQLRAQRSIALNAHRAELSSQALKLKNANMSNVAIGREMGIPESSVRALLDPALAERQNILHNTANMLKARVDEGHYIDIGSGTENHLGISATKLQTAVAILEAKGYVVQKVQVDQLGTAAGNKTTIKVLAPPGTTYGDIKRNQDNIRTVSSFSDDGGRTYTPIVPPRSIHPDRVSVRFAEQGGANADGVIYVRPGVDDVSLGSSRYAQVRIKVGDNHFLKGMAMYKDDLPEGVDLLFNTNKSETKGKLGAMKELTSDDAERPFGAVTRQKYYTDAKGKKQLSVMNIVNEEGDWQEWSRTLSSQFLSKQSPALAKRQLDLAYQQRAEELKEIMALTNPVVKRKLLKLYSDGAESAAVHLKAAALPSQRTHVILPFEKMKEDEIYAPNYPNGTRVALVRFPHAGTFEIPELTVNNKYAEARKAIGTNSIDAVGIHPKTAQRLSGADFDGDTVLVIPNNRRTVTSTSALDGLKNFDPQAAYPAYEGMAKISPRAKQQQMGDVSNLITDMTVMGAKPAELAAAVRHSMVIIDAEKHNLNYKQSYEDNGIANLKRRYQGVGPTGRLAGAATIISRSGNATVRVPQRVLRPAADGGPVDRATGERVYVKTGATRTVRTAIDTNTGQRVPVRRGLTYDPSTVREKTVEETSTSRPLLETKDAHTLVSKGGGTPIERIYADHSNRLKALSNQARKEMVATKGLTYSTTAAKTYAPQVARLNHALNVAQKNRPLERQAQLVANSVYRAKLEANPHMEDADKKKERGRALKVARERVGAGKELIEIQPDEWQAIQAGAISSHKLSDILDNTNLDKVKELATPRTAHEVTPAKLARAQQMLDNGYSQAEVAQSLGIPTSTLNSALVRSGVSSG